jgi:hypothetical protein
MICDLKSKEDLEALRDLARQAAFYNKHQDHLWFHRAYLDLAHAADVLASFLERE